MGCEHEQSHVDTDHVCLACVFKENQKLRDDNVALVAESKRLQQQLRVMLREASGDQGTIDRLKRELRAPCQRCEMRREGK